MSSFSADEVEMMRNRGNAWCAAVWLGLFDAQPVDYKDDEKIKEFIIAKYEKKRYYVDPSQARISRVSSASPAPEQLSSTSSRSSLASGSLIGSTLKARMDPSSQVNISVSRPGASSRPSDQPAPPRPISNGLPVAVTHQPVKAPVQMAPQVAPAQAAQPVPQAVSQQPSAAAAMPKASESFGNFADFDSAAFDSMPADPLTTQKAPLGFGGPAAKGPAKPPEDKYSALAELDDLFKSTAIQEPVFNDPVPSFPEPQPPVPPTADLFQSLLETGGGGLTPGGGVFGAVERASNGSPAGSWGRSASPRRAPSNNMWAGEGWDAQSQGAQLVPQHAAHSTNPFGTSPSNPPYHAPDNNNDLFAAAPKPFFADKQAAAETNPWTGVGTFTADMKPAHNPNNPFL